MRIRTFGAPAAAVLLAVTVLGGPAHAAAPHTFATNKHLATVEAHRLMHLAELPPGSTRMSKAPHGLTGPAMGIPTTTHVDLARFWRVPRGSAGARRWITHHRPAGLHLDGQDSTSAHGRETEFGYGFASRRHTAAWTDGELGYAVKVGKRTTEWRLDAVVLPYAPKPIPAGTSGRAINVRVASGCPHRDHGAFRVAHARRGPDDRLVRTDRVTGALLCRYNGTIAKRGHHFALATSRVLSATRAAHLARLGRHVSLSHLRGGVYSCPMDDGSAVVLDLHYATGADVDVRYASRGCTSLTNGTVDAEPSAPHGYGRFTAALRRLTR